MTARLTEATWHRAEAALAARREGKSFASVRAALGWYYEARQRLQAPNPRHPHTEPAPYRGELGESRSDTRVLIQVDGGKGGDMDDILATLLDIQRAVEEASRAHPRGMETLYLLVTTPRTQGQIADLYKVSQASLSVEIGKVESHLKGALTFAGIVR